MFLRQGKRHVLQVWKQPPPPTEEKMSLSPASKGLTRVHNNSLEEPLAFSGIEDLVTFLIGPSKHRVQIHKKFVCHHSPILQAAFNSGFLEGSTQTYELDNVTESTFALFCQWIYTQKLEHTPKIKLDSVDLNVVMNLIDEIGRITIVPAAIAYAYENTAVDSPLRRIYVSQVAWTSQSQLFVVFASCLPKQFALDVAAACRTIMTKRGIVNTTSPDCISRQVGDYYVKED